MLALRQIGGEHACTRDELRRCLDAAGLAHEVQAYELHLRRGEEHVRIVVPDAHRVTLASLDIYQTGCDTLGFELARALVARFGAIRLVDAVFGAFAIDGRASAAELAGERRERVRLIGRRIADDMSRKLEAYGHLGVAS